MNCSDGTWDMEDAFRGKVRKQMREFEGELTKLINAHSIENIVDMPDFILSKMICRMIINRNLIWHGCDSAPGSLDRHLSTNRPSDATGEK